jgi:malonyl-CoA/methylmalonyl-CoA synthetase
MRQLDSIPIMTENFFDLLALAFARNPAGTALKVPGGADLSYADLTRASSDFARLLEFLGVTAGDRVLVQVDKSPEAVGLYLGCLRHGAVYVPINTAYTASEVGYFLEDAGPALFVCDVAREEELAGLARTVDEGIRILSLGSAADGSLMRSLRDLDESSGDMPVAARNASDIAAILYTSGTTGRSKGAMLTHGNLATSGVTLVDYWGWQEDDVLLHALPVFHVHGLFVALHCALLTATPMIFLPGFDADTVLESLPDATVMMGVPTFYTRLLGRAELTRERCAGMRLFISGSAPLTSQTFESWESRTGHRILERYGMSETMMNVSNPLVGERVAGTVGFALPGVEVRIASESGASVKSGEVGVIEVRGPNVFAGYWQMPEKTAEEFRADGFFITGDQASMDAEGRISIVGREKDMVISGGYNVYPKEVESLIDAIPGVVESAVVGIPHADFGEGVVAVIVPDGDELTRETVNAALAGQIARFKQPKAVINRTELPRNAMGKVQKNQLRIELAGLFSGDATASEGTA